MLNIIWPIFIIISFSYAIISGNLENLNSNIFDSLESAISLSITMLGTMCLWSGIINIASHTKIINMNMVANILGLGNAATPLGLKAMESLQKENTKKNQLSNSMIMLIVLNTASIQIIPTTVIAIRNSLGSNNPTIIILPVWIATICAAIIGIIVTKILIKYCK